MLSPELSMHILGTVAMYLLLLLGPCLVAATNFRNGMDRGGDEAGVEAAS